MRSCLALLLAVMINTYSTSGCSISGCPIEYTFGIDRGNYPIIFETHGTIEFLQKTTIITLPRCGVKYVQVELSNLVSTPTVRYDIGTSEIIIQYGLLDISRSTYHIIVKGKRGRCNYMQKESKQIALVKHVKNRRGKKKKRVYVDDEDEDD